MAFNGILPAPPAERFWAKVNRSDAGCWEWAGSRTKDGYGRLAVKADGTWAVRLAHRFSYELHIGPIPDGLVLDHLCRTPACVNPAHLEAVTQAENVRRAAALITACPHGHPYTPENIRLCSGHRVCRECSRISDRRRTPRDRIRRRR
jgi:hypothetical protein